MPRLFIWPQFLGKQGGVIREGLVYSLCTKCAISDVRLCTESGAKFLEIPSLMSSTNHHDNTKCNFEVLSFDLSVSLNS